jgi:hypothetical protein
MNIKQRPRVIEAVVLLIAHWALVGRVDSPVQPAVHKVDLLRGKASGC